MCPGCGAALALHDAPPAQPALLNLVKEAGVTSSVPEAPQAVPNPPEDDAEPPLYAARRKSIRSTLREHSGGSNGPCFL